MSRSSTGTHLEGGNKSCKQRLRIKTLLNNVLSVAVKLYVWHVLGDIFLV